LIVNKQTDLGREEDNFKPKTWVLPFKEQN
jgi:hypothetical protein